jgi:parvulin-like peptidyl-prolyl isomerase
MITLVFVSISFVGCGLFTPNLDHNYSQIVASIDNISITKKELVDTYNLYGYVYAQSYGYSIEEAYTKTLESLVDREIKIEISKQKFGELTEYEKLAARKTAYSSLDTTLKKYIDEIEGTAPAEEAAEPATEIKYTDYTKYIERAGGIFEFNLDAYREAENVDGVGNVWIPTIPSLTDIKVARKALGRIIRGLQNYERGFENLEKSTEFLGDGEIYRDLDEEEKEVLNREIKRMVTNNEKNILMARLETCFELGIETKDGFLQYINRGYGDENFSLFASGVNGAGIANTIALNAITQYKGKIRNAIIDYKYDNTTISETTLVSSLENVYYIPTDIADKIFTVSHILVGWTDEQKAEYAEINANTDPSFDKVAALNALYASTESNGKYVYDIYNEVKSTINSLGTLQEKQIAFRDLIYKYNTDPGMQNPNYEYAMSTTKENNQMIEAFTDAAIDLKEKGIKGGVSGIVWGEYGAHIIMYTRDVSDFIYTSPIGTAESSIDFDYEKSLFAPMTSYGEKTRFDALVEGLHRNYTNYEKALLNDFKAGRELTIYKGSFKDLIK